MLEKYAGLVALSLVLFWVWKDSRETVETLHALGGGHRRTFTALAGG